MKISYISAVSNVPQNLPGTMAASNQLEDSIYNALVRALVEPFCDWVKVTSAKALYVGEWSMILGCAGGIIIRMFGIKKGEKIAKVCALIYIGIQIVKVVFL